MCRSTFRIRSSSSSCIEICFDEDDCAGILLADADNVFNVINLRSLLHNIKIVCPVTPTYVINSYHQTLDSLSLELV